MKDLLIALMLLVVLGGGVFFYLRADRVGDPSTIPASSAKSSGESSPESSAAEATPAPGALADTAEDSPLTDAASVVDPAPATDPTDTLCIVGRVTDLQGGALADVVVGWHFGTREQLLELETHKLAVDNGAILFSAGGRSTTTSDDGRYELRVPQVASKPAEHEPTGVMVALKKGYEGVVEPLSAEFVDGKSTHDFTLRRGVTIRGSVKDAVSGAPAAGMKVVVVPHQTGGNPYLRGEQQQVATALVADDGNYELFGIPDGQYTIRPQTGDSCYVSLPTSRGQRVSLEGKDLLNIDFEVFKGGIVRGRIVNGDESQPVPSAHCFAWFDSVLEASISGDIADLIRSDSSNSDGEFEFRGVPLGDRMRIRAEHPRYSPQWSDGFILTDSEPERHVEFVLSEGSSVQGSVRYESGEIAVGTPVRLLPMRDPGGDIWSNWGGGRDQVESDPNGDYQFDHLAAGVYYLYAGPERIEIFGADSRNVTAETSHSKGSNSQVSLSGAAHSEASDSEVSDSEESNSGDLHSAHPKQGLTPGHVLEIELDGVQSLEGIDLVIPGSAQRFWGTVVDVNGEPIPGARVTVKSMESFNPFGGNSSTTDDEGYFDFPQLATGNRRVIVMAEGYARRQLDEVDVGVAPLEIELEGVATLRGRVETSQGEIPSAIGTVHVESAVLDFLEELTSLQRGTSSAQATLTPTGEFELQVPPGDYVVVAEVAGFASARSYPISLQPGEEYDGVILVVDVGVALEGRVTLMGNVGVEGAKVRVRRVSGDANRDLYAAMMPQLLGADQMEVSTDSLGHYRVEHLAPGDYTVVASHHQYAPSDPQQVSVRTDRDHNLASLVLSPGGSLTGRLTRGADPRVGILVQLMGVGVEMKMANSDVDGRFQFLNLRPGHYSLIITDLTGMQAGRMDIKQRSVTLREGESQHQEIAYGVGVRVHGKIEGMAYKPFQVVTLRRPGGPTPEQLNPLDMEAGIIAGEFTEGMGFMTPDGRYEIPDVRPGTYILELLATPDNPADIAAMATMDRTPGYRTEITIGDEDVEHEIYVGGR